MTIHWTTGLTNASSVVTIVGTTLAVVLAARVWRPVSRVARLRDQELDLKAKSGWWATRKEHVARIEQYLTEGERSVTHELTWLNSQLGGGPRTTLIDHVDLDELRKLSESYLAIAGRMLRVNALDPSHALMSEMAGLHVDTATELAKLANSEDIPELVPEKASEPIVFRKPYLPLEPGAGDGLKSIRIPRKHLVLELVAYPGVIGSHVVFDCLAHVQENEATKTLPPSTSKRYEGHLFDGVLPALNSAQLQKDARTGRIRLALSMTPVRYSDVERDHFYAQDQHDEIQKLVDPRAKVDKPRDKNQDKGWVDGTHIGLLTCSFMPVTSDGYLVLVERGPFAGAHAGDVGPAVTGNLDLAPRNGEWVDRLASGCPDLRLPMQREAKEELGLDVPLESIYLNALARFTSTSEINSNVLCATAMLDETLEEVASGIRNSDLGEGRWELGGHLVGLKLPTSSDPAEFDAHLHAVMSWLATTADLPPHATVNGWAALATALSMPSVFGAHFEAVVAAGLDVTDRAINSTAPFIAKIPFNKAWTEPSTGAPGS